MNHVVKFDRDIKKPIDAFNKTNLVSKFKIISSLLKILL